MVTKAITAAPGRFAYADFVTAMMAFFLLLWLLNATTEEQRQGIADYFAPTSISASTSGAGGILGGLSVSSPGAQVSANPQEGITISLAPLAPGAAPSEEDADDSGTPDDNEAEITDEELDERLGQREEERFAAAEEQLRQAIQEMDTLEQLSESLIIDRTPEGLRIQIIDQEGLSMFPLGGSEMFGHTRELLTVVARVLRDQPNQIAVDGHTDGLQFSSENGYSNWELSSDRANASRRALLDAGLQPDRIARVVGKADTDPLFKDDPASPRNRRISIVLLRDSPVPKATGTDGVVEEGESQDATAE